MAYSGDTASRLGMLTAERQLIALPSRTRGYSMSYYRLYFMSSFTGHIERFEEFGAGDDREAVAVAETKQGPLALELWCSHRKVAQLDAIDLASQLLAQRRVLKAVKAQVEPEPGAENTQSQDRSA